MEIETIDLEHRYPDGTKALEGISLKIETSEKRIAIMGANGSGKTTLLLHLNGILKPTSGKVLLEGVPLRYDRKSLRILRSKVGFVFQNPDDQLFAPTLEQDVAFGPLNLELPEETVRERVEKSLEIVGLEDKTDKPPHLLSGGEKKRAAIAGILAMQPEIMILDEPTTSLDPEGSEEIIELLEELALQGKTILISTHNVELAYRWAEKLYILNQGKLTAQDTPQELFKNQEVLSQAKLTPPKILTFYQELLKRQSVPPARTPKNELELIELTTIPNLKQLTPPPQPAQGKYAAFRRENKKLQITGILDKPTSQSGTILEQNQGCLVIHLTNPTQPETGTIQIYDTAKYTRDNFQKTLKEKQINYLGVMGTKAKTLAKKEKLEPDFTTDVINKTLLQAIAGYNCLILTSGGMVEHTKKRIQNYGKQTSLKIKIEIPVS